MKKLASLLTINGLVPTYDKMWSNGIKTSFFPKTYKNRPAADGGFAPRPLLWYVWVH